MTDGMRVAKRMARECLGVRCRVLARMVSHLYERRMTDAGVRIGQMNLLVAIANHGQASPGQLARGLMLEKSTMSRDLQHLKGRGLITIGPGTDARTQAVSITEAGLKLIESAAPAWDQAQKAVEAELGPVLAAAVTQAIDRHWQNGN